MTQPQYRQNSGGVPRLSSLVGVVRSPRSIALTPTLTLVALTTSQTYTIPPNTYNKCEIEAWAAGGSASGTQYNGGPSSGSSAAQTVTVTNGMAISVVVGAAVSTSNGGNTTVSAPGVAITCTGGNTTATPTGGAAPTASGGDVQFPGRAGAAGDGATICGAGGGAPPSRRLTRGADGSSGGGINQGASGGGGPGQRGGLLAPGGLNTHNEPPADMINIGATPGGTVGNNNGSAGGLYAAGGGNPGGLGTAGVVLLWLYT